MPGHYIAVGLYSGVAVKRGSTVDLYVSNNYACIIVYRGWSKLLCVFYILGMPYISQEEAEGITFPDAREHTSTGIQVVIDEEDSSFSFESVLSLSISTFGSLSPTAPVSSYI